MGPLGGHRRCDLLLLDVSDRGRATAATPTPPTCGECEAESVRAADDIDAVVARFIVVHSAAARTHLLQRHTVGAHHRYVAVWWCADCAARSEQLRDCAAHAGRLGRHNPRRPAKRLWRSGASSAQLRGGSSVASTVRLCAPDECERQLRSGDDAAVIPSIVEWHARGRV